MGERYGRPVRMCSQPSHPVTRLTQAGADAAELLSRIRRQCPSLAAGPQVEALRQIMVRQFVTDARGRLRLRRDEDGFPPAGRQICSPYDLDAVRRVVAHSECACRLEGRSACGLAA